MSTDADTSKSEEIIVIHVSDEKKNMKKNYQCKKGLLLKEMKYFENHLTMADSAEDIDISVQCDIDIFEWLMKFIKREKPELEPLTAVPILISADFLQMKNLIQLCTQFIAKNLNEMATVPLDMSNISPSSMKSIASQVSLLQLDQFKDPHDRLQSKIYQHKLYQFMEEPGNKLSLCRFCGQLYTAKQATW